MLKALGHPIRQWILQVLNDEVASPNQLTRKLGEPLSNVSCHVKVLESCDAIVAVWLAELADDERKEAMRPTELDLCTFTARSFHRRH